MKAIIFDFDGVIHDTFAFHKKKIEAFAGVEFSEDEFRDIHNGNFFVHKNDKLKDTDWFKYRDHVYKEMSNMKIKDETREALVGLSKNHELFIISSGGTKMILDYLKNNDMKDIFKEVIGMDIYRSKLDKFGVIFAKYRLSPIDCIFVTDTLGDILEANMLNIRTIAVDFGYHKKEILSKGNPFKIVSSVGQLLEAIDQS
jgi:phosphoglycolate phosphatase-like HAD superfamily hydrolase